MSHFLRAGKFALAFTSGSILGGIMLANLRGRFLPIKQAPLPDVTTSMSIDASTQSPTLLEEIDAQQNELLDQLDALNARIEQVLKECLLRNLPLRLVPDAA